MIRPGIHVSNSTFPNAQGFFSIPWGSFTLLDGQAEILKGPQGLCARYPDAIKLVRFFLEDWSHRDPVEWAEKLADQYQYLREYTRHITWANEQNIEGHPEREAIVRNGKKYPSRKVYEDIRDWNLAVIRRLRETCPDAILHFPALAAGLSDDQDDAGYIGYEILRPAIELCDVLDTHNYWSIDLQDYNSPWAGLRFIKAHAYFPDKPIFISEAGGWPPDRPDAARQYKLWLDCLQYYPYLLGVTFFIWKWDNPDPAWDLWDKRAILDVFKSYQGATPMNTKPNWLTVDPAVKATFKAGAEWIGPDDPRNNGSVNIYAKVIDEMGRPLPRVHLRYGWPGGSDDDKWTDANGEVNWTMDGPGGFRPADDKPGPFYVTVLGGVSDTVRGMGMEPSHHHTQFQLTFTRVSATNPPPTSDPAQLVKIASEAQTIRIAVNDQAALIKAADKAGIGHPETNEFRFTDPKGQVYAGQEFARGYAYCKEGDWGNVVTVHKEGL